MAKMKTAVVTRTGSDFEIQERESPRPGAGQARIRMHACGVCFSDHYGKDGLWPGLAFPRTPWREVTGTVDEVGVGVTTWKQGQRVGVTDATPVDAQW
jgi:D-arabinose 1-dehydrogenase-like Zn-dependent alcohol dehydrogenase